MNSTTISLIFDIAKGNVCARQALTGCCALLEEEKGEKKAVDFLLDLKILRVEGAAVYMLFTNCMKSEKEFISIIWPMNDKTRGAVGAAKLLADLLQEK